MQSIKRFLSFVLIIVCVLSVCVPVAYASGVVTSLGLAEQGLTAYDEGWQYLYGGKGQVVDGKRVTDCAGLIYSYFSDNGKSGCMGGCTAQVKYNCVMSSKFMGKIPRIHGLTVTMYDNVDPGSGIYGHVGIYAGGDISIDNSTYGVNIVKQDVYKRGWTEWHLFDNGLMYPVQGWYKFRDGYVYYDNFQYVTNIIVDGHKIDSQGMCYDGEGLVLSNTWAPAVKVRDFLLSIGYKDNGGVFDDLNGNAVVTGSIVNVRQKASTASGVVIQLRKGDIVEVVNEITGQSISDSGRQSDVWYKIRTVFGHEGYISSLFVQKDNNDESGGEDVPAASPEPVAPGAPVIEYSNGWCEMSSYEDCDIYYTTDGTSPKDGELYTGWLGVKGVTYRAVCCRDGLYSPEASLTVCSNGSVFTDFTFDKWYAHYVDRSLSLGLFSGKGNNKFGPDENITRGQFALILARAMGADLDVGYESTFDDVSEGAYYANAVGWAYANGIVSGVGKNKFAPESFITREQMCVMFARAYGLKNSGGEDLFIDDSLISGWSKDAVYACKESGFVSGTGGGRFSPKGHSSRAQAATVLVRIVENVG